MNCFSLSSSSDDKCVRLDANTQAQKQRNGQTRHIKNDGGRESERAREREREKKTQPFFFTSPEGLSPTTRAGLEQDVRIKARILNEKLRKKTALSKQVEDRQRRASLITNVALNESIKGSL